MSVGEGGLAISGLWSDVCADFLTSFKPCSNIEHGFSTFSISLLNGEVGDVRPSSCPVSCEPSSDNFLPNIADFLSLFNDGE